MPLLGKIKYDGPGVDSNKKKIPWLVYKFPSEDLVIGSQLIVFESQEAVFYYTGKVFDAFGPGRHTLTGGNLPLLQSFVNIPFGGNTPFTAEVYFVNKVSKLDMKWGTDAPIQVQEPKFGIIIGVRSFGQYGIKIKDSRKFIANLTGVFQKGEMSGYHNAIEYFKGLLLSKVKTLIANVIINQKVSIFEISAQLDSISSTCKEKIEKEFNRFGIEVVNFFIQSINIPEEDVKRIKSMLDNKAIFDNLGNEKYKIMRGFDALEKMATNKGTTGMGVGMGTSLGYGIAFGKIFGDIFKDVAKKDGEVKESKKRPVSTSDIEYLKELAKLKKDGIITEEEFNLKKKQILSL